MTYNNIALLYFLKVARGILVEQTTNFLWESYGKIMAKLQQSYGKVTAKLRQSYGKVMAKLRQSNGKITAKLQQSYGKEVERSWKFLSGFLSVELFQF